MYWNIQIVTWSITAFYWGFVAYLDGNFNWNIGIADFILDVWIGISVTHAYKTFAQFRNWIQLDFKPLVIKILLAVLIMAILYSFLVFSKLYLIRYFFLNGESSSFLFSSVLRLQLFITGLRLMSIWVLAFHLYHYAIREIKIIKENAELAIAVKEAQLSKLSSQLNPHFFFNALNNIKFQITQQPQSARRAIDLLADLLRNALHTNIGKLIPLQEEIQLVNDYLELEAMRFEERLEINVVVDPYLLKVLVLPLCIQTLVENAIKHGIEKKKEKGFIEVKVNKGEGFMSIRVQNSGTLRLPISSVGIGLKNLKERLALQYNGKAVFEIKNLEGSLVLAEILIPLV